MNLSTEYRDFIASGGPGSEAGSESFYTLRVYEPASVEGGQDRDNGALAISTQNYLTPPCRSRLLFVSDHEDTTSYLKSIFRSGFTLESSGFSTGLVAAEAREIEAVIIGTDTDLDKGTQLLKRLKQNPKTSHIPVVLMAKTEHSQIRLDCYKKGADDFLTRQMHAEEVLVRINNLISQRRIIFQTVEKKLTSVSRVKDSSQEERFLQKVNVLIEGNISNPRFSVVQLAELMNLSRAQLFRKLKRFLGVSPNQLINDVRLQRAAELIAINADTLTQIGYRVGFNEHSYFAKRFKEKFGTTPSEYAELSRKRPQFQVSELQR